MFQYWADIKYKARKKSAAGGALGDLSSAEERVQNIFNCSGQECNYTFFLTLSFKLSFLGFHT